MYGSAETHTLFIYLDVNPRVSIKLCRNGGTFSVYGTTGFAVHRNAYVEFEPRDGKEITVSAESTGLTVEQINNGVQYDNMWQMRGSTVVIKGGTFQSTGTDTNKNGIWFGESQSNMTITGGTFIGSTGRAISSDVSGKNTWGAFVPTGYAAYNGNGYAQTGAVNNSGNYIVVRATA